MTDRPFKIGTRGSPLALAQAEMVRNKLAAAHPQLTIETIVIRTSGDWKPADGETRLSEREGGKGLFVKEIEQALMEGRIDCAVHSLKDVPSFLPDGMAVDHMLERADPRDAFISRKASSFLDLPHGAVVGTASLRRQAFLLTRRPDLVIVPLRGNVATRIAKLDDGMVDATFLAMAGLNRLGLDGDFIHPLSAADMLPACGQGTIGIETRLADEHVRSLLDPIHHTETGIVSAAERAALQTLDGSCHTPIGAYAEVRNGELTLDIAVASGDGRQVFSESGKSSCDDAAAAKIFGHDLAAALKARVPPVLFQ